MRALSHSKRRRRNLLGSRLDGEHDSAFADELGHADMVRVLLAPSVATTALLMAILASQIRRCGAHSRFVFFAFVYGVLEESRAWL